MPIESVNDFVVRFANVNGSGSAQRHVEAIRPRSDAPTFETIAVTPGLTSAAPAAMPASHHVEHCG